MAKAKAKAKRGRPRDNHTPLNVTNSQQNHGTQQTSSVSSERVDIGAGVQTPEVTIGVNLEIEPRGNRVQRTIPPADAAPTLNQDDRIGGAPVTLQDTEDFQERIQADHVQCQWRIELPNSEVIFHPDDTFGYCPGLLKFFEMKEQGSKPFRFFDMWTTDPQFLYIVSSVWNTLTQGTKMFIISRKLEMMQHPLWKLNRDVFGDVQVQYAVARNVLNDIMRHHLNHITLYQMEDVQWKWEYEKVVAHFVTYYRELLGTPMFTQDGAADHIITTGPCLSILQQVSLVQPFTAEDVKRALFSIPSHKSPGPDELNSVPMLEGAKMLKKELVHVEKSNMVLPAIYPTRYQKLREHSLYYRLKHEERSLLVRASTLLYQCMLTVLTFITSASPLDHHLLN
ncbi:hypothetical protein Cgig2_009495 [Carnegiea gigantea]|uniref:Uncharacterized protein n=1 Tax=Carnegiea gigantea TaxID=171969 RepID=A0A9Q1GQZ6_9CARY|nr:hypothetical protein Cgig2_009495 [Carnegiea gigantea]